MSCMQGLSLSIPLLGFSKNHNRGWKYLMISKALSTNVSPFSRSLATVVSARLYSRHGGPQKMMSKYPRGYCSWYFQARTSSWMSAWQAGWLSTEMTWYPSSRKMFPHYQCRKTIPKPVRDWLAPSRRFYEAWIFLVLKLDPYGSCRSHL